MDSRLIEDLRREEQSLLEVLRSTAPFRRLEALREVLALHDDPPPIGAVLDALLPDAPRLGIAGSTAARVIVLPGPRSEVA